MFEKSEETVRPSADAGGGPDLVVGGGDPSVLRDGSVRKSE
jgi:hypothetical protein